MEKKNLFMQPRQILLWNFDATIPPTAICIYFFARFFFAGRQATGLSGGHAAWGILLSPYPPAAANPEGYGGRAQTAALAIAWRAMEHTYPELGTGHCCRHPPPPPAAATNNNGSCFDLEIDVVVSTRWCNIFPNAQLGQPWIH